MSDLPEMKTQRYREVKRANSNRVKRIAEAYFIPGPNADEYPGGPDKFICPAGPGLGPIPQGGRWYDVTDYLRRAVASGDAAEGQPPQANKPSKKPARKPAAEVKE